MKRLSGTEKQINWATDIRENIIGNYKNEDLTAQKAVRYIKSLRSSRFWIDYKSTDAEKILQYLVKGILRVNGLNSSRTAKIDKTGQIIETQKEIVNDGRGGHWVISEKIIDI